MDVLLRLYLIVSWILLASFMWSDWYESRKPGKNLIGYFMLIFYVMFMPAIFLWKISRISVQ